MGTVSAAPSSSPRATSLWTWLAYVAALIALIGSLYLSMGMGLKACPLCLYQRTFIIGVVGILGVGLIVGGQRPGFLSLLALPLAVGALSVAIRHEYLEQIGRLECPDGVFGLGKAPQQSLAILIPLVLLLSVDVLASRRANGFSWLALVATIVLGVVFSELLLRSGPPAQEPPAGGWPTPLNEDGCRKPAAR
jgi:disulfide bond formation protein DsbB